MQFQGIVVVLLIAFLHSDAAPVDNLGPQTDIRCEPHKEYDFQCYNCRCMSDGTSYECTRKPCHPTSHQLDKRQTERSYQRDELNPFVIVPRDSEDYDQQAEQTQDSEPFFIVGDDGYDVEASDQVPQASGRLTRRGGRAMKEDKQPFLIQVGEEDVEDSQEDSYQKDKPQRRLYDDVDSEEDYKGYPVEDKYANRKDLEDNKYKEVNNQRPRTGEESSDQETQATGRLIKSNNDQPFLIEIPDEEDEIQIPEEYNYRPSQYISGDRNPLLIRVDNIDPAEDGDYDSLYYRPGRDLQLLNRQINQDGTQQNSDLARQAEAQRLQDAEDFAREQEDSRRHRYELHQQLAAQGHQDALQQQLDARQAYLDAQLSSSGDRRTINEDSKLLSQSQIDLKRNGYF